MQFYSKMKGDEIEAFRTYILQMDCENYWEYGPDFLEFIDWVNKLRNQTKNDVFETLVLKIWDDFIATSSIVDDDQNIKEQLGLDGIFIWWVNVNPLFRGKWYGDRVFLSTLEHIKKSGYKWKVYLFTDNPVAKHMYEKHWFQTKTSIVNTHGMSEELMVCECEEQEKNFTH